MAEAGDAATGKGPGHGLVDGDGAGGQEGGTSGAGVKKREAEGSPARKKRKRAGGPNDDPRPLDLKLRAGLSAMLFEPLGMPRPSA